MFNATGIARFIHQLAIGKRRILAYRSTPMKRILFLFNHDAGHQVAHLANVAVATARLHPQFTCTIAYATPAIRQRLDSLIAPDDRARLEWIELRLEGLAGLAGRLGDVLLPASRLLRLRQFAQLFSQSDAVVSTERTCLRARHYLTPERMPAFVMIPHGAGDRNVSYHPDFAKFDRVLVAGPKVVDQMAAHGVAPANLEIVGYPKFESVDLSARLDIFDNDRPTFVYNPHFDPHLSSWYRAGPDLLRWFASDAGQAFNCIFAPHVMLFRKRLHISPEYRVARFRPDVPEEAIDAPNIHIDTGSERLFDMSYLLTADGYIGDVSSQIYEFLVRPRPAFFIDPRKRIDPDESDLLIFRKAGPVVGSAAALALLLSDHERIGTEHETAQRELFAYTFDLGERTAADRAATAIAALVSATDP